MLRMFIKDYFESRTYFMSHLSFLLKVLTVGLNKSSGFHCSYTVQRKRGNIIGSLPTLNSTGTDIMSKNRLNYLDYFNFLWYKEQ